MGSSKISNSVKSAANIQRLDTSYFIPWQLDMLYEIEPELENVAKRATVSEPRIPRLYPGGVSKNASLVSNNISPSA